MIKIESEPLPGVYVLENFLFKDLRGSFNKIYNEDAFKNIGLKFNPKEHFFTTSKKNVLRGMHFQVGNSSHEKLIYCSFGSFLDVVVDVRKDSEHFNKPFSIELSEQSPKLIFIGKGYAHGFLSKTKISSIHYLTSTIHNPTEDKGVLWNSIDFNWKIKSPILSKRDLKHPSINEIKCEFS